MKDRDVSLDRVYLLLNNELSFGTGTFAELRVHNERPLLSYEKTLTKLGYFQDCPK